MHQIRLTREVPVPVARAFEAWTKPEVMARWFCPEGLKIELTLDPVVGGRFRFEIHKPDGDYFGCAGAYTAVDPPHRISFTWKWDESSFDTGESLVDIQFEPVAAGTLLTLTHTRLASNVSEERHTIGWTAAFDRFETFASNLG